MNDETKPEWEEYARFLIRIKVEGGYLYTNDQGLEEIAMSFVPDIDLTRYQAHLRDAYKKGYSDGQADARVGIQAPIE